MAVGGLEERGSWKGYGFIHSSHTPMIVGATGPIAHDVESCWIGSPGLPPYYLGAVLYTYGLLPMTWPLIGGTWNELGAEG